MVVCRRRARQHLHAHQSRLKQSTRQNRWSDGDEDKHPQINISKKEKKNAKKKTRKLATLKFRVKNNKKKREREKNVVTI